MKFRVYLIPVEFEAENEEEANELLSEVLMDADIICTNLEEVKGGRK